MANTEQLQERLAALVGTAGEAPPAADGTGASLGALRADMRRAREAMAQALLGIPQSGSEAGRGTVAPPNWATLRDGAETLLAQAPPRLEAAMLWTEAAGYCDGFAGLGAGLSLAADFIKTQWDALAPRPASDELTGDPARDGDIVCKRLLEPLAGPLAEHLGMVARRVTLFRLGDGTPYTFDSYLHGRQRDSVEKLLAELNRPSASVDERRNHLKAAKEAELALPEMQPWPTIVAVAAAQANDIAPHRPAIKSALAAVDALKDAIQERGGLAIASPLPLAKMLGQIAAVVAELAPEPVAEAQGAAAEAEATAGTAPARATGPVASREQAVAMLGELAGFFRRIEPHSPIGDVLEELGRRARLSWSELIAEVLPDNGQREQLRERLGLRRQAGN